MGTNTLTDISSGTVQIAHVNDIHTALNGDLVPRNNSGVATDLAGRLGTPSLQWAELRTKRAYIDGVEIGLSPERVQPGDIISGKVRSTSNQPAYLTPSGSTNSLGVKGATTNLIYDVSGTQYVLAADLTISSLTVGPSSNHTCLVNDSTAAAQESTRTWGEILAEKESITVDTMGSTLTALVGTFQSFKVVHGGNTEYFMGFVQSTTSISNCFRGFFFDSSLAPMNRIGISDNDTITLMKTAWIFLKNDLVTLAATYTNPTWSNETPSSPASGDYWYDMVNKIWKSYNGSSWSDSLSALIGFAILNTTACIGARCMDFAALYSRENTIRMTLIGNTQAQVAQPGTYVNVAGNNFYFNYSRPLYDITTDLAPSADLYTSSEQVSRRYYFYVTDLGARKISDVHPYYSYSKFGYYHPHNPWRCIGYAFNNSSGNFQYVSYFPGNSEDTEVDFLDAYQSSDLTYTDFDTYHTVTVQAVNSSNGSAIINSGDNFQITKKGFYEVLLRSVIYQANVASPTMSFEAHLYNVTTSAEFYVFLPSSVNLLPSSQRSNVAFFGLIEIDRLDDSFRFETKKRTNTASTYHLETTYMSWRRINRAYI